MSSTDDLLPGGVGWPWTTALVVGPPLVGKGTFLAQLLAAGVDEGAGAVVVSTDESADDLRDRHPELDRAGVRFVDATGTETDDRWVWTVRSPADLTGIGMALDDAMESLDAAGYDRVRVGVDSLTTLDVYTDTERVSRFVNVLSNRFATADYTGLFVVHGSASEAQFGHSMDASVEFRDGPHGVERRVVAPSGPTEWRPFEREESAVATHTGPSPDTLSVASLADLFETVDEERLTLTLVNAPPDTEARLAPLFDRLQVDVRSASLDVADPSGVGLLHRGADLLAADPVAPLLATAEGIEPSPSVPQTGLGVVDRATRALYSIETDRRPELVRTSRLVETMAGRAGGGVVHAGFQRLSRLANDADTLRVYRQLSASGLDVHLYGQPDATLPDGFTVHGAPSAELEATWFVAFDGAGDPDRMAALLAEETEPNHYDGFWTYRPELVTGLVDYLDGAYGGVRPTPSP